MAENHDLLICPFCHGHGEVLRTELREQLTSGEFTPRIDALIGEIVQTEAPPELAAVAPNRDSRNFQKDVHSWNPQLPMWRRSPKE